MCRRLFGLWKKRHGIKVGFIWFGIPIADWSLDLGAWNVPSQAHLASKEPLMVEPTLIGTYENDNRGIPCTLTRMRLVADDIDGNRTIDGAHTHTTRLTRSNALEPVKV